MDGETASRWDLFTSEEKAAIMVGMVTATGVAVELEGLPGSAKLLDQVAKLTTEIAETYGLEGPDPALLEYARLKLAEAELGARSQDGPRPEPTDPREPGGEIIAPDGDDTDPYAEGSVVVNTERAVLLTDIWVTAMLPVRDGEMDEPAIALQLGGRINKTRERADILYLLNSDGAAGIVSEVLGLAARMGDDWRDAMMARVAEVPK